MAPTSASDPAKARQQRLQNPPLEDERAWVPLWLAGPVVALMTMLGLIALVMLAAAVYTAVTN